MKIYTKAVLVGIPLAALSAAVVIYFSRDVVRRFMIGSVADSTAFDVAERSAILVDAFKDKGENRLLPVLQNIKGDSQADYIAALDATGKVLAHTNVAETGKIYDDPFTRLSLREDKIQYIHLNKKTPPTVLVAIPIRRHATSSFGEEFLLAEKDDPKNSTIGLLEIEVPLTRVLNTETRISKSVFWIVVATFGLVMLLLLLFLRHILRPIHQLAQAARRIGEGHFGETVPVQAKDEVGELAETFNQMSHILAKTTVSKEQLQRSEQLLSAIISSLTEAIFIVNSATRRIVSCNAAAEAIFGYTAAELSGQPLRLLHVKDEMAAYFEEKGFTTTQAGKYFELEYQLRRKSGDIFPVETFIKPIDQASGVIEHHVFVVRDISERKKAEEARTRLSQVVEQAVESVVITDTTGKIIYVNQSFEVMSGYKREELLGENPRIFKSGKQDKAFYEEMWSTVLKGDTWSGRMVNRRKNGTFYEEESIISPVRDTAGGIVSFASLKRDITQQTELEQQLMQSQKMDAIGRLAGGVAHDFNNLLTSILGFAQMALDQTGPENPISEDLNEILKAGERAAALTQQLLAFSRKQVIEPRMSDLNSVVGDMEKMLERLIREDIKFKIIKHPNDWHVKIDPNQFGQVLVNLVVNARDAMPKGGTLVIEVKAEKLEEEISYRLEKIVPGEYVVVSVSDTGSGMLDEVQGHLFEPFFTTKPKGKGTGLGLATVYGVIKQNKGFVTVYSKIHEGTTFRIYLPRFEETPKTHSAGGAIEDVLVGDETVMIVEDEKVVRAMAQRALGKRGYKILAFESGEEALRIMENMKESIDLLLTDVVMPEMSGPALAKKVQTLRPGIKVLFMSGYTDEMIDAHGILEDGTNFIQKPFTPNSLAKKVREVLG